MIYQRQGRNMDFRGLKLAINGVYVPAAGNEQGRQVLHPYVVLAATNMASLNICDIDHLKSLAIDGDNSNNNNRA